MIKTVLTFIFLICAIFLFLVVSLLGFIFQIFRKLYRGESLVEYFKVCAIGEDQRGGSYLYGTEDWTISAHTYYKATNDKNEFALYFMRFIDFCAYPFDGANHCKKTYEKELSEHQSGGV